ncbi:hypothetical protein FACS189432_03570 [Bacteroidia bacterium]|nr:hypothetical protein FACS189432_03570 [Bacteroidia bacterium]GHV71829.1 hypothetical protein FACS189420_8100 [Bacteroidia bacterium]
MSAQEGITYRLDAFGSLSSGNYTPFWIISNTYGVVPLKPNNGYLRGDVAWNQSFGKDIKLEAGIDLITAAKHTSDFWIQQLYAGLAYRNIHLTIGEKELYNSLLDNNLSQGDFNFSNNARPISEINISFPHFTTVPYTKGRLKFKADFAIGKFLDKNYVLRTKNQDAPYSVDMLLHHKSLFFRLEDPKEKFPFLLTFGLSHSVQWGGWTSSDNLGQLPESIKDFFKIVFPSSGDENAPDGDQINILGNHLGAIDVWLGYKSTNFQVSAYKQNFYEDNSGLEYANWRDGIWGGEITFFDRPFLKKAVLEFMQTTNQSGPLHFLFYDTNLVPGARGGGNDDYYNNYCYVNGWSYFGKSIGNPLLTSPEYNGDGTVHFKNNRLKSIHLGVEGKIAPALSYRTLFTGMYAWGTMNTPFLKKKNNFSALLECNYEPQKWKDWKMGFQLAFDKGSLYGDNFGCSLKVSKSGIIRF